MPNHQLVVIADADDAQYALAGVTTRGIIGQISSFVFRGAIDYQVGRPGPHHGQNPANWATKNILHELTHQWTVNAMWLGTTVGTSPPKSTTLGHCPVDTSVFDAANTSCLMATSDEAYTERQSDNLIARYHLRQNAHGPWIDANGVAWHSEAFEIRMRTDPFVP